MTSPGCRRLARTLVLALAWTAAAVAPIRAADPVVLAAGDIADCANETDTATATLLDDLSGTVVTLGDNVYPAGGAADFRDCYGPTWGRHLARTRPAAGNHDRMTLNGAPYFDYFGDRAGADRTGWYSYDLAGWHIVVLDSNCAAVGGCGPTSPQAAWLRADLAAHPTANVLAYWHHPRFSSGTHGSDPAVGTFWDILYAAGADLILNGHDHDYERFAPQDPAGRLDSQFGIRQFVVGTGGAGLRARASTAANSQRFGLAHGVLRLTLRATGYDWAFVPIAGNSFSDAGSGTVHGIPTTTSLTVRANSDATVDQARPGTNFGAAATLWVDGNTGSGLDRHTYVRFKVAGTTGTIDRATLRLWVTNATRDGPRIYRTSTTWSGRTIIWRNRPGPLGAAIADLGAIGAGRWLDVDVTSVVRGDGPYAFLLRPTSGDGLGLSSMQGAHPPRLVLRMVPALDP